MATRIGPGLPREFAPGIHWLGECVSLSVVGRTAHGYASAFLIVGDAKTLLVDTGMPQSWEAISSSLDAVLGGRSLDYVFPTHPELPHAGNIARLLDKYPAALAVGDVRDYHLYYPHIGGRLSSLAEGAELDLGGGYRFAAVEAVIRDLPNTHWGYEASQQVLFVSDGFSYFHQPPAAESTGWDEPSHEEGECALMSSEFGKLPDVSTAAYFAGSNLYWTRHVDDSTDLFEEFQRLTERYPTRFVAPTHSNVVDNLDDVVPVIREAHRMAYGR
jgi:hypothetical protein